MISKFKVRVILAVMIAIAFAVVGLTIHEFRCLMMAFIIFGLAILYVLVGD